MKVFRLRLVIIVLILLLFPRNASAFLDVTGFGGMTFSGTTGFTAGVAGGWIIAAYGGLVGRLEGEAWGIVTDEVNLNFNINFNIGWPLLSSLYSVLDKRDVLYLEPYFIVGGRQLEDDLALNSGLGVRIYPRVIQFDPWLPTSIRIDYRHFFRRDSEDLDRVYIGVNFAWVAGE